MLWGFPLEAGRPIIPCVAERSAADNALACVFCVSSPNTEPNDGIGANVLGLVCMLGLWAVASGPELGERLIVLVGHRGELCMRSCREDVC